MSKLRNAQITTNDYSLDEEMSEWLLRRTWL